MKSFFLAAFIAVSATDLVANDSTTFKTLEDVFGPLEPVESMAPKVPRSRAADVLDSYKATRLPDECIFPLDIVLVQDSTDSFTDDYPHMIGTQLSLMVSNLKETHPGSTVGLISFRDKPITPFGIPPTPENGYYSDYCARIDVPLSDNVTALTEAYLANPPNGGGDAPENQFHTLLGATQAQGLAWPSALDRTKLVVMVTDAPPHFGSDGSDPQGMIPFGGNFDEDDIDGQCVTEFYPEPEQVQQGILAVGAYAAFVIYDPEYMEGLVGRSWTWFNRFLGQTDDFITLQAEDSSDFWTKLAGIIGVIEEIECIETPTETPVITTLPPDETVTPVGTIQATTPAVTDECPPCPTCPPCEEVTCPPCPPCPPCPCPPKDCPVFTKYCQDGVLIKLGQAVDELQVVVDDVDWDV
eukprot:Blabericola_migrator_1__6044@NODE_3045_length_2088_cov_1140_209797_g1901_i0_p1_GENE_NODE_3045_length_2088_cov_1140_209797_g1901_i0NODE_3045_length_2088_cov_1140_209797_g1901_i0_p1_ORF_typecomplete_len412_score94_27Integrin_beta/PF00362_18/1_5e19VWA/PF00092_28/5_7e06VWA_2/PF13519_6/0_038_NODE_3045_length_2088_cov_1140_209797_g1901_i07231958